MVVTNTFAVLCLMSATVVPEIAPEAGALPSHTLRIPHSPPGKILLFGLMTDPPPK